MSNDLGYSYKILRRIPVETNRTDIEEKLLTYLADICEIDINNMHFFDESSVVRTSGNQKRGHSAISDSQHTRFKGMHRTQLILYQLVA